MFGKHWSMDSHSLFLRIIARTVDNEKPGGETETNVLDLYVNPVVKRVDSVVLLLCCTGTVMTLGRAGIWRIWAFHVNSSFTPARCGTSSTIECIPLHNRQHLVFLGSHRFAVAASMNQKTYGYATRGTSLGVH